MTYFKDPAVLLGNILGEFKLWYTKMSSEKNGMASVTCDQFPRYRTIIDLTGRVMYENSCIWSNNVKRNIEVAFCVTGLADSECFFMLLDDPMLRWVWNAVKQLCTSSLPQVRRLVCITCYACLHVFVYIVSCAIRCCLSHSLLSSDHKHGV